jgi:hypothetical protein
MGSRACSFRIEGATPITGPRPQVRGFLLGDGRPSWDDVSQPELCGSFQPKNSGGSATGGPRTVKASQVGLWFNRTICEPFFLRNRRNV